MPPSQNSVDYMTYIDELEDRREEGIRQGQGKNIVDQTVLIVQVLLHQNISNDRNQHRVHQLSHYRLQSITNFSISFSEIPLIGCHHLHRH